jgi:hypothetical protein
MKTLFCLLLTFTFGIIYSQEKIKTEKDSIILPKKTCEKGIEDAKLDAKNGKYKSFSYGYLFKKRKSELYKFIKEYRENKYGIIYEYGGFETSEYSECYSKTIAKILFEKFGADIFEKSRKEAEELYLNKKN